MKLIGIVVILAASLCTGAYDVNNVRFKGDSTLMGMGIKSVYDNNGSFDVETTGAKYKFIAPSTLQIYQGLEANKRLLSTIIFDKMIKLEKAEDTNDHVLFWSEDFNLGIYGDSTCIIAARSKISAIITGKLLFGKSTNERGTISLCDTGISIETNPKRDIGPLTATKNNSYQISVSIDKDQIVKIKVPKKTEFKGMGVTFLRDNELYTSDKKTLSPDTILNNLSKYDFIWQGQDIVTASKNAFEYVRKNAPDKPIFLYVSAITSQMKTKYAIDYDYIDKYHPEWFLLADAKTPAKNDPRKADNRIRWETSPNATYYNRFYMDIANSEFQDWVAQKVLEFVSGKTQQLSYGYSGVALDNVVLSEIQVRLNKPYPNWKYKDKVTEWNDGYLTLARKVREKLNVNGYKLIANFSAYYELDRNSADWDNLRTVVDGIMHEWAIGYGPDATGEPTRYWSGYKWELMMKRHEDSVNAGLIDWWACYPGGNTTQIEDQSRFSYCSFLLLKQPNNSYFYLSDDKGYGRKLAPPWFIDFDINLGYPIEKRQKIGQYWAREYENAIVLLNATTAPCSVDLSKNSPKYIGSKNTVITNVVLNPKTGLILRKASL